MSHIDWLWLGWLVGVFIVGREFKIRLGRKKAKRDLLRDDCDDCVAMGKWGPCSKHEELLYEVAFQGWPFLAALWPIALPYYLIKYTALGVGGLFGMAVIGVEKAAKVVRSTEPARTLGRVNRWYWQDPKERKKEKNHVA